MSFFGRNYRDLSKLFKLTFINILFYTFLAKIFSEEFKYTTSLIKGKLDLLNLDVKENITRLVGENAEVFIVMIGVLGIITILNCFYTSSTFDKHRFGIINILVTIIGNIVVILMSLNISQMQTPYEFRYLIVAASTGVTIGIYIFTCLFSYLVDTVFFGKAKKKFNLEEINKIENSDSEDENIEETDYENENEAEEEFETTNIEEPVRYQYEKPQITYSEVYQTYEPKPINEKSEKVSIKKQRFNYTTHWTNKIYKL